MGTLAVECNRPNLERIKVRTQRVKLNTNLIGVVFESVHALPGANVPNLDSSIT